MIGLNRNKMPFKKHLNKNAIPQKALCLEQLVEMIDNSVLTTIWFHYIVGTVGVLNMRRSNSVSKLTI